MCTVPLKKITLVVSTCINSQLNYFYQSSECPRPTKLIADLSSGGKLIPIIYPLLLKSSPVLTFSKQEVNRLSSLGWKAPGPLDFFKYGADQVPPLFPHIINHLQSDSVLFSAFSKLLSLPCLKKKRKNNDCSYKWPKLNCSHISAHEVHLEMCPLVLACQKRHHECVQN